MAPGIRNSKRVRAEGTQVQPSQTRSSKRLQASATDGQNLEDPTNDHDEIPAEEGFGASVQDSTFAEEDSGAPAHESTGANEDNVPRHEDTEGKL
jgi:hypothetical protein